MLMLFIFRQSTILTALLHIHSSSRTCPWSLAHLDYPFLFSSLFLVLRGLLMVGLFNFLLVLLSSSDGMIFKLWEHFNTCVTTSYILPEAGRCLRSLVQQQLFSSSVEFVCNMFYLFCLHTFPPSERKR